MTAKRRGGTVSREKLDDATRTTARTWSVWMKRDGGARGREEQAERELDERDERRRRERGAGGQEAIGMSDRISLVNQIWPNKRRD